MSNQDDPNDSRGESLTTTTRRATLTALGLGGLAALGSGSTSAAIGGGPDSDAMSEYRVPYYRVSEADLDSPGVVGRRVEITSGGSAYAAGDQLVDTGSSWELIDSGVGSLKAESGDINTAYSERSLGNEYTQSRRSMLPLGDISDAYYEVGEILDSGAYPTIIHAQSVFDNPLGKWYIYASPYNTDSINLFYADEIDAQLYTDYGTVISSPYDQADAGHAIYDPDADELLLYYHESGDNDNTDQYTLLATADGSGDGTTFSKYGDPTPVLSGDLDGRWDDNERTYMTVQSVGNAYVGVYQGRDSNSNERGIGVAWSFDGRDWKTLPRPVGWGQQILQNNDPTADNLLAPTLVRFGNQLVVCFADRASSNDSTARAISFEQLTDDLRADECYELFTHDGSPRPIMFDTMPVPAENRTYVTLGNELGYIEWGEL